MKKGIIFLMLVFVSTNAFAASRIFDGRKTVTSAGTAEALSATSTEFNELTVCAETDNTGVIAVGETPIAALATRQGVPLLAGDCYSVTRPSNLSTVYIDTTVNGDGVTFYGSQQLN